jgi:hypothetical protein
MINKQYNWYKNLQLKLIGFDVFSLSFGCRLNSLWLKYSSIKIINEGLAGQLDNRPCINAVELRYMSCLDLIVEYIVI